MRSKRKFYQRLIHHNLTETYRRMELILSRVPLDQPIDIDKNDRPANAIRDVLAIEEEWIIDPVLREELSLIDLDDRSKR